MSSLIEIPFRGTARCLANSSARSTAWRVLALVRRSVSGLSWRVIRVLMSWLISSIKFMISHVIRGSARCESGALMSSILLDRTISSRLRFFFLLANLLHPSSSAFSNGSIEVVSQFLQHWKKLRIAGLAHCPGSRCAKLRLLMTGHAQYVGDYAWMLQFIQAE